MAKLDLLLSAHGIPLKYNHDRAAIDTGFHVFIQGPKDRTASQTRVWFQAKGKRKETLPAEQFAEATSLSAVVKTNDVRFWYAAPEPVYLAIYVEAVDLFVAEDVRVIVDRRWPNGDFYEKTDDQKQVTLRIDIASVLDETRLESMLKHRSMRIDGPSFQGRPLGHRFDPLRSELRIGTVELWRTIVVRLLEEYQFRCTAAVIELTPDLRIQAGRFYDTMIWQSSAFAEIGVGLDDDFRDDPPVQWLQGKAAVVVDARKDRHSFSDDERTDLKDHLGRLIAEGFPVIVFFYGKDLSGIGGVWRSLLRDIQADQRWSSHMIGYEAITSLVLVATLVYIDLAPKLAFDLVNYRF